MTQRVCTEPGCPELVTQGRCTKHRRQRDAQRGTRTERGYGPTHQAARKTWQARINAGQPVHCWRPDCHKPIHGTHWHLGHDDYDRTITRGPECATCNLSAAGKQNPRH